MRLPLGKGAEEKEARLYLVASANDFGGEAEAGTEPFSVAEERDRLIILKDVRLLPDGSKEGEVATHDASKRVDVEAPTQKELIHRAPLFNLERQGETALLAATELRTNRVLIVSPEGATSRKSQRGRRTSRRIWMTPTTRPR